MPPLRQALRQGNLARPHPTACRGSSSAPQHSCLCLSGEPLLCSPAQLCWGRFQVAADFCVLKSREPITLCCSALLACGIFLPIFTLNYSNGSYSILWILNISVCTNDGACLWLF